MAINQIRARSQDQLHIHLSCLGKPVFNALQVEAERIGPTWTVLSIDAWNYHAIRIAGTTLGPANPIGQLADLLMSAPQLMGEFTMLVAGMQFKDGPGFVLLAGASVPGAELLLDSTCAITKQKGPD
jgi:CDP-diacylglycerol pyrophosphatase